MRASYHAELDGLITDLVAMARDSQVALKDATAALLTADQAIAERVIADDVRIDVAGPDGPLTPPSPIVDQATVSPGYLIKKPNSYGNVFTVPEVPEGAQSVTLTFTYQLLAPDKPKSKVYTKQVATDTVTVAINSAA